MESLVLSKLLRDNPLVVTGMGAYSAAGDSVEALWQAAMAGRGLAAWREFPVAGQPPQRFAVCSAPPLDLAVPKLRPVRKADRCAQMALQAARHAWKQSEIHDAYPPDRMGVIIGSSRGPVVKMVESYDRLHGDVILPTLSAQSSMGSLSGMLAQAFGLKGPGTVVSATCASAAFAIGLAAEQILLGKADAMLVGGAEAPLHPMILAQLQASGVLGSHEDAARACRPFDATRNGMVPGEGSAFLVLESAELAAGRGAHPFAYLTGWSMSTDSSGRTGMREDGSSVTRAMRAALALAQLAPREIGYVNAHGSATVLNDVAEAAALKELFGERGVACSSTKPVTGHCLGATPALAAVLCIEALRRQQLPPAVNCARPDPQCPVQLVAPEVQPAAFASVLANAIGFWGYHASLIFSTVRKV
jgi:3-oxoacyl-(acyl-carrier-protein) synthase